jgi:hypothetical protein
VVRFYASARGSAFSAPHTGAPQVTDSVLQRRCAVSSVSEEGLAVQAYLWTMWITPFCHAFRLTTAVEKALTTATFLDTALTVHSSMERTLSRDFLIGIEG